MERYPIWKPLLVIGVIVLSLLLLYPPDRQLKPGLDLAGGTTMVYQVDVPKDMDSRTAVDQVIASLKKRVDPKGVRNLVWRRLTGDRFEVQMALASPLAKQRRDTFVQAQEQLIASNLSQRELDRALRLEGEARKQELERLGAGSAARLGQLMKLANARDAMVAAREPYDRLIELVRQADAAMAALPAETPAEQRKELTDHRSEILRQLVPVTRAYNQARAAVEEAEKAALASNINPDELERVLNLPDRPRAQKGGEAAAAGSVKTIRQEGIEQLLAAHPDRQAELRIVIDAWQAYDQVKGPLDDPSDLITLLRGSGVLEFRIAPRPGAIPDEADYRKQLTEKGPRAGADKPYKWLMVDRDENGQISFAETSRQLQALTEDPQGFFAGMGLVGQYYGGEYYILLADTPDKALTRSRSGWELTRAFPDMDSTGFPAVSFRLNAVGGAMMAELTGNHVGEPMAICLDGRVISAPRINDRISDSGIITGGSGGFSSRELNYLVRTLNAGALTARVSEAPISIKTTGPQLGQDNLRHGLLAAVFSFLIVAVFMIGYYFFGGVIAIWALIVNILMILAAMAMLDATFTLPGIAGIVLTIGMAVDANVLIYERVREEQEAGQPVAIAIRRGYEKAFSTIVDANLTTLITCIVLYYTATTEIKGFALVLGLGIVATLFTAVFCTRVVFDLLLRGTRMTRVNMLPTVSPAVRNLLSPNVDWLGKRYLFMTISLVLWVGGLTVAFTRGTDLLDIEFRSGTEVSFELRRGQTLTLAEVRDLLDAAATEHQLPELSGRRARVVTLGQAQGARAASFSVQTLEQDSTAVSRAIKTAFASYLDEEVPLSFQGMNAASVADAPVRVVTHARLGEVIDRRVNDDVSDFLGGVAIVLEDIHPAVTEADLASRIKRMRMQPAYEGLNFRECDVIGLDLAPTTAETGDAKYRSAVVVSRDNTTNYIDDPQAFANDDNGLAATEWRLVHDALTRDTSLGSVSSFSSQVSNTMKIQAIQAIVLSLLAVVAYIWFRFGKLTYGLAAIVALVHDVGIAVGLIALSHYMFDNPIGKVFFLTDFKVDIALIAAILTLIGYSLNDTIVVFDRIRENRGRLAEVTPAIINASINQTISRTVITALTTLLAVGVLYVEGGEGVHGFGFLMAIGVIVGTYSSIAIASPILLINRKVAMATALAQSESSSQSSTR